MEVVIETQEEVTEQPVVIELSAECLSMVGGGVAELQFLSNRNTATASVKQAAPQ